ncbi:class I SAM-dependent methyltransferase [Streptomyces tremellae]|uniref:1,6-didemethyltoxoflavin N1-methyltransferase n=1 Tax=Streptomyces tremellae TaxID=1124239 RepID=A0ABP7FWH3_9ACTN
MATTGGHPETETYRELMRRSFHDLYASEDDRWTDEPAMKRLVELVLEELAPDSRVLDVGAGRGRDTGALLAAGHRVTAADLVELPEWAEITARWGDRVRFVVGDVRGLRDEEAYDAVLDNGVLHHQLPGDQPAHLAALHALLRPGGLLGISLFVRGEQESEGKLHVLDDGRLSREFTEPEARSMLAGAGFTIASARRVARGRPGWAYLLVLARRSGD